VNQEGVAAPLHHSTRPMQTTRKLPLLIGLVRYHLWRDMVGVISRSNRLLDNTVADDAIMLDSLALAVDGARGILRWHPIDSDVGVAFSLMNRRRHCIYTSESHRSFLDTTVSHYLLKSTVLDI